MNHVCQPFHCSIHIIIDPDVPNDTPTSSLSKLYNRIVIDNTPSPSRKFGKQIQKRQLEIPEYAASFVDYKALKKLIKTLSATPVLQPQSHDGIPEPQDPRASLKANRASFFFRLDRELEKVNTFYLQKEAELKLRLSSLLEQKKSMQAHNPPASKVSSRYIALEEGFRQFGGDLAKLQQFIEINQTAFSKILKKWDKASKSDTKVIFLSRAVEVQPIFNRDVISELSDQATSNMLDFAAWADGERMQYSMTNNGDQEVAAPLNTQDYSELDPQIFQAFKAGNVSEVEEWARRVSTLPNAQQRITKAFLSAAEEAPDSTLQLLLQTNQVDLQEIDAINHRNILHRAAISGRESLLKIGLQGQTAASAVDIYGRIPLHYACMHGADELVRLLLAADPSTIDVKDHDNFTPLIHAISKSQFQIVHTLLLQNARIEPISDTDHIPLNLACQHADVLIVKEILTRRPQLLADAEGLYPQHLAARSSEAPQLLSLLREYGADLDQRDKLYQWTPLFHASSEGNVAGVQWLLESEVDTNVVDEKGLSALYYATWEGHLTCIRLLAARVETRNERDAARQQKLMMRAPLPPSQPPMITPAARVRDTHDIPPLILPSPIIPVRRYGHNFLDSKTYVIINFGGLPYEAIQFYDDNKYPAARLTISSKSSDLVPRNLLLPIQDELRVISFQIDNLDTFSIDFDVYPTFGARVIARAVASSKVFTGKASSSGEWHLELLDPRLRAIGRISFTFQVITPFPGQPLEITHFATYWKETDQKPHNAALITGSSLSGDYVRLYVQLTSDGVAVLFPQWKLQVAETIEIPLNRLTWTQFESLGQGLRNSDLRERLQHELAIDGTDTKSVIYAMFNNSFSTLREALAALPGSTHVELHIMYPSREQERNLRLGPTPNINAFADALLTAVFEHARQMREESEGFLRSIVFSSLNPDICTALNWKQPNYPVLLCNELGVDTTSTDGQNVPRTSLSVKEAVHIAKDNNFMGLICNHELMNLAPRLVETIKTAGLVLIGDISHTKAESADTRLFVGRDADKGIDGTVQTNGVLHFNESVDM
ncbi:e3 ubiquitin-protein ligase nedd4 [Venturia nashicola]|uniref:E3 ubiquitin-protein ligase nedd4 n=1 Tax=Venturia nashicola TaxID=86259 RepID=A0A4Z1NX98_9PEZI|nr:e3 ubiquitin-protein ligase nedd4 [Venturia nashicola]